HGRDDLAGLAARALGELDAAQLEDREVGDGVEARLGEADVAGDLPEAACLLIAVAVEQHRIAVETLAGRRRQELEVEAGAAPVRSRVQLLSDAPADLDERDAHAGEGAVHVAAGLTLAVPA